MITLDQYWGLNFRMGGRARPAVDCYGLYRLIVGEHLGVWLDEFGGVEDYRTIARTISSGTSGPGWIRLEPGAERPLDMVMLSGIVGRGRDARSLPLHVGCVVEPGLMLDIEETKGVMRRAYRTTPTVSADPSVVNRVIAVLRPTVLA